MLFSIIQGIINVEYNYFIPMVWKKKDGILSIKYCNYTIFLSFLL